MIRPVNCNKTGTLTQHKSLVNEWVKPGKAKLVFPSFELKYLTPKMEPYIKSKLLKSYIKY